MDRVLNDLFEMRDEEYRSFCASLTPTVSKERIIGIRVPHLRKYAKNLEPERAEEFMKNLPHTYYEENNLHAFLIERITDMDKCLEAVCEFLPFVDNWGTCDMMSPKVFVKNKDKLINYIEKWIRSDKTYTVRYGIVRLMSHFLDGDFKEEHMYLAAGAQNDEYYVNMAIAWYFATALAKQYDAAESFLKKGILSDWVHNKAIQKAIESKRISDDKKEYLNTLKKQKM